MGGFWSVFWIYIPKKGLWYGSPFGTKLCPLVGSEILAPWITFSPQTLPGPWLTDPPLRRVLSFGGPKKLGQFEFCVVSHRIHVWYIYLHLPSKSTKCRCIYHTWMVWVWVLFGNGWSTTSQMNKGRKNQINLNKSTGWITVNVTWCHP